MKARNGGKGGGGGGGEGEWGRDVMFESNSQRLSSRGPFKPPPDARCLSVGRREREDRAAFVVIRLSGDGGGGGGGGGGVCGCGGGGLFSVLR